VMIGVEIAISMLPPASVIGIGFAFGNLDIARNAAALLIINVLALDVLGSMLIFILRGMRKRYFDLERTMRQIAESALMNISKETHDNSIVDVTLLGDEDAHLQITLRGHTNEIPDAFAQQVSQKILQETNCTSEVLVEMSPCQTFSTR
jgi:hypothetical protein